ncbi:MAG TPA: response regulator [Bacteroidales bacterium]|nr:response regulator [Bacteroidales bacterium]
MKLSKKIFHFINKDSPLIESEDFNLSFIISLFSTVAIVVIALFGLMYASEQAGPNASIFRLVIAGLLLVNLLVLHLANRYTAQKAGSVLLLLVTVYFLTLVFSGEIKGYSLFWLASYPILALLSTSKRGNLYSLLFLLVVTIALFLPISEVYQNQLSTAQKVSFVVAFLGAIIMIDYLKQMIRGIISIRNNQIFHLQDELKEKEEFISKVSHQIRTPLNNIVVVSNMLNPTELGEKEKDYFDTILASTNNLVDVVNSFSDITNVDIQERRKYEIRFDLNSTLRNTRNLFLDKDTNGREQPIAIHSEIDQPLIGDPVKVKQIFLNLIEQILKHSDTQRMNIRITSMEEIWGGQGRKIRFELSAAGLHSLLQDIREKSQVARARKIIEKLEIHIAKRTIKSLGGDLQVFPADEGLLFRFDLEMKQAVETEEKPDNSEQTLTQNKQKVDLKDANVLLVEDNLINQKIVLLSLKKTVRNVDVANNGKEALDKFGSVKYDIILMDIQMPVMNGIVTTQKIRNLEKSSNTHTPIIAITANALLGDKEECLEAGTDDYISKPFQIETLLEKMGNLLA